MLVGETYPVEFTLTNQAPVPVTISSIHAAAGSVLPQDLHSISNQCLGTLQPAHTCKWTAQLIPNLLGSERHIDITNTIQIVFKSR